MLFFCKFSIVIIFFGNTAGDNREKNLNIYTLIQQFLEIFYTTVYVVLVFYLTQTQVSEVKELHFGFCGVLFIRMFFRYYFKFAELPRWLPEVPKHKKHPQRPNFGN